MVADGQSCWEKQNFDHCLTMFKTLCFHYWKPGINQGESVSSSFVGKFLTKVRLCSEWWGTRLVKKNKQYIWQIKTKKQHKISLNNEITKFLRFIVIRSLKETPLTKLTPFLIERVISCKMTQWTMKNN